MRTAVTRAEIKKTIFSMNRNKVPGPNGFSAEFFHKAWLIVENGVVEAILEFFEIGNLLREEPKPFPSKNSPPFLFPSKPSRPPSSPVRPAPDQQTTQLSCETGTGPADHPDLHRRQTTGTDQQTTQTGTAVRPPARTSRPPRPAPPSDQRHRTSRPPTPLSVSLETQGPPSSPVRPAPDQQTTQTGTAVRPPAPDQQTTQTGIGVRPPAPDQQTTHPPFYFPRNPGTTQLACETGTGPADHPDRHRRQTTGTRPADHPDRHRRQPTISLPAL
ncbi:proline-rich receptor-like protein kinase PERK9 [Alnus glutinosa]|uniref:proline-rich receptor-like protein kinase PERK9 n=1 Tax=Alnus glutinosa TaxID=3517 RepID=UPI002D79DBE2|nr:proline-rich receptor-like protein kinase PERK9 [Alnus glutinosa]